MQYTIAAIGDIHWGVMNAHLQFRNLSYFFKFLETYKDIDLLVIDGDYFESRLSLNSLAAQMAVYWFDQLIRIVKKKTNIKAVRIIKGTDEHDGDQLEVFRSYTETGDDFVKIFFHNTVEETLPGLRCMYCPEENINMVDYRDTYAVNLGSICEVGFFHGSFDIVLPELVVEHNKNSHLTTMIYEYSFWSSIIRGPMISAHWHDGVEDGSLIYLGSPDRWKFKEPETKGFGLIRYDTDTGAWCYKKIPNPYAVEYSTITVNTSLFKTAEDFHQVIEMVDEEIASLPPDSKFSIIIEMTDTKHENDVFVSSLKSYYAKQRGKVKFTIKDKVKKDRKKQMEKRNQETAQQFSYLTTRSASKAEVYQRFILDQYGEEIPLSTLESYLGKYIKVNKK